MHLTQSKKTRADLIPLAAVNLSTPFLKVPTPIALARGPALALLALSSMCLVTTQCTTRIKNAVPTGATRKNLLRHSRGEGLHHIKAPYTPRRDSIQPARPNPRPRSPEDFDGPSRKRQRVPDAPSLREIHRTSGAANIAGPSTSTEVADPMIDTTANFDDVDPESRDSDFDGRPESQFHDDGLSVLGVKDEQEQEANRSIIFQYLVRRRTFSTDDTSHGGMVTNINRDYNVNFNIMPGSSSTPSRSAAQLRAPFQPPSDQITKIYVAVDPFCPVPAIRSIDRVCAMSSMVQTMMANPMLCSSEALPETLASLERLLALMELALRAYRHTNLVHCLSSAFYIRAEECRQRLDDLISNLENSRHNLSNAVLYYIRKYISFAACLLALGRAAWPELKRGQGQETLDELAKFYAELEQDSTSLRRIRVDAAILHLGMDT
ncbi:hypothetical protein FIBSPDRAFT_939639 [Athelia psychrophila]|uniref:Uncharacterized protein n=1 Tax=Athelia psychrophila TaxID=1759441 RepID=A0A167XHD1_9AGAM|nr:hypothetical protein FIBSPDRAFT_939639 [Fibularhizoctonia sp. CBS 109695]